MLCSTNGFYRFLDAVLLLAIFLFQSVILNLFIINKSRGSSLPFLWFLCDFFCLLMFSLTLFLAFRNNYKRRRREKSLNMSSSNSVNSGRTTSRNSNESDHGLYPVDCFAQVSRFPFSYISWIVYSVMLIAKIVVLFKAEVPQTLPTDGFFGSQMMKFAIGVATIIFSLIVEAHHDFHDEPIQHEYIKSLSYGMAIEIIDSTSFLGLLIGSESHLVYTWRMENFIIALASLNLMLPAISLYKLTLPNFGTTSTIPLDSLYKLLHLACVNIPYFGVRVYLWQFLGAEVSVFIIKNVYFIVGFLRDMVSEIRKIQVYYNNRSKVMRQMPKIIPMGKLNEGPIGSMDKPLNTELGSCRL